MPKNQLKMTNFKWFLANAYFDPRLMKDAQLCFIDQPNFIDQLHKSAEIN